METWRRVALLVGVSLAIWLFFYASLEPIVTVEPADFARMQAVEVAYTEEGEYLRQLPLDEYIEEKSRDRTVTVSGEVWSKFFRNVTAASLGEEESDNWTRRISREQTRWQSTPYQIFFRPQEEPLSELAGHFAEHDSDQLFLRLEQGGQVETMRLSHRVFSSGDFELGTGLLDSPYPPSSFLHPYRTIALWVLLGTIAAYLLIPWKKRDADAICYPYRLVALGDLAAMVLFIPFFALPMLIIGGSVQAITTQALLLTVIVWPFAFAGAWLSMYMAEYGSYQILIRENGLYLETCRRQNLYLFDTIDHWEPLELRPPRWLTALLWLASFAGKGARSYQAAGQAMMLSGSSLGGVGIRLKNGSAVYLWINAQMGKRAASHFQRLLAVLESAGIPHQEEVRVIESVTMPDGEGEAVSAYSRYRDWSLWAILLSPLVVVVFAAAFFYLGETLGKVARVFDSESRSETTDASLAPGELTATGLVWEKTHRLQGTTMGQTLLETSDGGLLIAAVTWQPGGSQQSVGVIRTDSKGEVLWSQTYGDTRINHVRNVVATRNGGYLLLGHIASRVGTYAEQQMCVRKIAADGKLEWERAWSENEEDRPTAEDAMELEDGSIVTWGHSDRAIHRLQLDQTGEITSAQTFDISAQVGDGAVYWISGTTDGGGIVTGETLSAEGGYKDLLLLKLAPDGSVSWKRNFGGKRRERGYQVRQLAAGGFVVTGLSQSGEHSDQDFYVVRTDDEGNALWEKTISQPGDQWAWRVSATNDGSFLVVGESRPLTEGGPVLFLVELGTDGDLIQEQHIARENANYTGADALGLSDGSRIILGSRNLQEFQDEIVLIKLRKE